MRTIDLNAQKAYRVKRFTPGSRDLYDLYIPCKRGHIMAHDDRLSVFYSGTMHGLKQLHQLGLEVSTSSLGDDLTPIGVVTGTHDHEAVLVFGPERLDEVAKIVGARKRRQISPEERIRLAEISATSPIGGRLSDSKAM